jgi:hypothetical protein
MSTDPTNPGAEQIAARTSRRAFMFGGVALVGGAALAACGRETPPPPALTGDRPEIPATTTTTNPGSPANDRVLLRTAQSIELVAVETYGGLLESEFLDTEVLTTTNADAVRALFRRLEAQHQAHADALDAPIRAAGATPVTSPNEFLANTVVTPQVEAIEDQETVLVTAHDLESVLAQTWVEYAGIFSTPELRQVGMTIGAIDARNITTINLALGYTPVPLPVMRTGQALDPKGQLAN